MSIDGAGTTPTDAGRTGGRSAGRIRVAIAAAIVAGCWLFYIWELSLTVPAGLDLFDFANNFLYAWDMLRGNWLLHGWVVTQDPHWLTDDLVYVLGLWVRGFDPVLLHAVPVVVYTILVVLVGWASVVALDLSAIERALVAGVAVLPLVFPSRTLSSQVLVGPYHTGTTAVALSAILAFTLSRAIAPHRGVRIVPLVLAGVLLTVGRISDPFTLLLAIAPIVIVTLYGLLRKSDIAGRRWMVPSLLVAVAAWAAAAAVLWLVPRLGGFTMRASLPPIMPLSELGARIVSFIGTFLDLSGGNLFGLPLGSLLIFTLVRLAYVSAAAWAVVAVLGDLRRGRQEDWTAAVLAIAVLVAGVAMFLYGPNDYLGDEHRAPVFVLMGVVLGRRLAALLRDRPTGLPGRRAMAVGLLGSAVLFAALPTEQFQRPQGFDDPSRFPQLSLARWLDQHDLRHGYGPYTSASIITVETRGRVEVRPLTTTSQYYSLPRQAQRLVPNIELMANSAWYTPDRPGTFLIVDNGDVVLETALQTFGAPEKIHDVGRFRVLTWPKGISCTLPPSTPQVRAEERAGMPPHGATCRRLE